MIPYHERYPLPGNVENTAVGVLGRLSPGEVPKLIHDLHIQGGDNKAKAGLSSSAQQELGTKFNIRSKKESYSRSEFPKTNTLRDGIDVINVSCTKHEGSVVDAAQIVKPHSVPQTHPQVVQVKSYEESETPHPETETVMSAIDTHVASVMGISDLPRSSADKGSKRVGITLKLSAVVIPSTEDSVNDSFRDDPSTDGENTSINYSSDFDFSSISFPS